MLTLASLAKTAKRYVLDSSISDEAFLNALLEPLVAAGRVKARGGKEFALDKSRTSLVVNGKCDVPNSLRKALVRYGIEDSVTREFGGFVDDCIDGSLFEPLAREVVELASGSGDVELRMAAALDDPERFMAIALLEAVKNDNRDSTVQPVWSSGTGSLCVEVGDLFAHGFGKARKMKQIVVVPVDTTFATEVTWGYESSPAPMISPKTLHGQWLVRMRAAGVEPDELADRIASSLRRRSVAPAREDGIEYPIGTVAIIPNARSVFYLVAISQLDENNNAHAGREDVSHALHALLETYDKEGQGLDIFIPLMGTGESRAGLTHQESLDLITGEVMTNKNLVHGKVTIVVYREDASKLDGLSAHSEDKSTTWDERKSTAIDELKEAPFELKCIVLADKLSNMRAIARDYERDGDRLWERFNAPKEKQALYYSGIIDSLWGMQDDKRTAPMYWELNGRFKDVFVEFFYDKDAGAIWQRALGQSAHWITSRYVRWREYGGEIPASAAKVERWYAEHVEDNWREAIETQVITEENVTIDKREHGRTSLWVHADGSLSCMDEVWGDGEYPDSEWHDEYSSEETKKLFWQIAQDEFVRICKEEGEAGMTRILDECGIQKNSHCVI